MPDDPTNPEVEDETPDAVLEAEPDAVLEAEPDTFPREYVEKLRAEAAEHRTRAQGAEEARSRLLTATIREATAEVLTDPTDLPDGDYLDGDGWPDPDAIRTAAEDLVGRKPHLGDRRPRGSIGQGATAEPGQVDLAAILRGAS